MSPADRAPRALRLSLFFSVALAASWFAQGGAMNQNSRYDLTRAVVEEGTLRIDRYADNTLYDRATFNGHTYSDKAPGLALAAAPVYAITRHLGPTSPPERSPDTFELHLLTFFVIGLASAFASVALFDLLVSLGFSHGASALSVIAWALGTNAAGYATIFVSHQFVAALFIGSFVSAYRSREADEKRSRALLALSGFLASWAVVSEYPAAPLAALAMAYALWVAGLRKAWPFVAGAAVPALVLGGFNAACFGSPFRLGYTQLANDHFRGVIASGFMGLQAPRAKVLKHILFGEFRGLLPMSPFLVFAVPGAVTMLRDTAKRPYAIGCVAGFVYGLVLVSAYPLWHGGAGMGPRYLVQSLPFAVPLVAAGFSWAFSLPRAVRAAASTLAFAMVFAAVAICTMTVAVMPELPDIRRPGAPVAGMVDPDMLHPLREFVIPLFVRGALSVKAALPGGRYGFATPTEHGLDAFNLGERMGLSGLASLAPLLVGWMIALVVALRALTRERAQRE